MAALLLPSGSCLAGHSEDSSPAPRRTQNRGDALQGRRGRGCLLGSAREGRRSERTRLRAAHCYGTSPSVVAHRLRNLRLLTDRELERLETILQSEMRSPIDREFTLPVALHEMDSLCSRLAAVAATALHRGNIDVPRFDELAEFAGVCVADRERLLAITASHPQHEHESSSQAPKAIPALEKRLA